VSISLMKKGERKVRERKNKKQIEIIESCNSNRRYEYTCIPQFKKSFIIHHMMQIIGLLNCTKPC